MKEEDVKTIETRLQCKGHMYSPEIRQVCYDFLSKGVSAENVSELIASVINNLTTYNLSVLDLPSSSSIHSMATELGILSRKHIYKTLEN